MSSLVSIPKPANHIQEPDTESDLSDVESELSDISQDQQAALPSSIASASTEPSNLKSGPRRRSQRLSTTFPPSSEPHLSASRKRKRQAEPVVLIDTSPQVRSKRARQSSGNLTQPSSKALGKRRAVSVDVSDTEDRPATTNKSKRRKIVKEPEVDSSNLSASYNLRSRLPIHPTNSKQTKSNKMPRKNRSGASSPQDVASTSADLDVFPSGGKQAKKRSRQVAATPSAGKTTSRARMIGSPPLHTQDDVRVEVEDPIVEGDYDIEGEGDDLVLDEGFSDEEGAQDDDGVEHNSDDDEADQGEEMPFEQNDFGDAEVEYDEDGNLIRTEAAGGDDGFAGALSSMLGGNYQALMSGISNRFKTILTSLRDNSGDPTVKLVALQELSEILSMSTEDTLSGYFSVEAYVRVLVNILRGDDVALVGEESGVEMMLLACRCLANLMEALPGTGHVIVSNGAVAVLCSKLLEIQYIDLAEQTLSTLEKLSEELPNAIVRDGGLTALLGYLDFFSTNVQRTAVTAAANCCRSLSADSFSMVRDVTPVLQTTLSFADQRVVEQACLAITRIIESYRHHPDKLEALLTKQMLTAILPLLGTSAGLSAAIGTSTYTSILRVLGLAARASPPVAMLLLDLNIANCLYTLLTGTPPPDDGQEIEGIQAQRASDDMFVLQNLVHRPKDQLSEALTLIAEILPALPRDGVFSTKPNASRSKRSKAKVKVEDQPNVGDAADGSTLAGGPSESVKVEDSQSRATSAASRLAGHSRSSMSLSREQLNERRLELLGTSDEEGRTEAFKRFCALLLPTLIDVYAASVGLSVRTKTMLAMTKIVHFCGKDQLSEIVTTLPIVIFLATVLSSSDQPSLVTSGLQLAELLLIKIPEVALRTLRKEGILFEVEQLAAVDLLVPQPIRNTTDKGAAQNADLEDFNAMDRSPARTPLIGPSGLSRALQANPNAAISNDSQMKDLVTLRARFVKERYLVAAPGLSEANSHMEDVKELVDRVEQVSASPASKQDELAAILEQIATLFTRKEYPISSYEMLESGLISALLNYMQSMRGISLPCQYRQQAWASEMLKSHNGNTALSVLVRRLQESLSRLEEFEVVTALPGAVDDRRNSASMLTRQLKLRLMTDDPDIPRSCSNVCVSIHAIATFQAFNDYLRPRISAATNPQGANVMAGLRGALAALGRAANDGEVTATGERHSSSFNASPALGESPPAATLPMLSNDDKPTLRRSSRLSARSSQLDLAGASRANASAVDDDAIDGQIPTPGEDGTITLQPAADGSRLEGHTPGGTRVATPSISKPGTPATRPVASMKGKSSYAAALKSTPTDWHLQFSLGDQDVQLDTTIYGAVHQHEAQQASVGRSFWQNNYTVKFRRVDGPAPATSLRNSPEADTVAVSSQLLPESIMPDSRQGKVLQLLRELHTFNADLLGTLVEGPAHAHLNESAFINNKLTAKMNRQLEEPMIVASSSLPEWALDLPQSFPFLFPFESRFSFLQSTSFGYARLMQKWVGQARQENRRDDNLGFLGRLQRQKVRIARDRLLESAFKVFELYGRSRAMLEIEFFSEVGTGLGPTLEFYALVSKEFSRKDLGLWREGDDQSDSEFVYNKSGLFPAPLASSSFDSVEKSLSIFRVLGQFVARALMDSRIVDLAFNRSFMRLVLDQELPLTIASVKTIDKVLGKSLETVQAYASARQAILSSESDQDGQAVALRAVKIEGISIEDLALDFTLPGFPEIQRKTDGKVTDVSIDNVDEYITWVIEHTLRSGVKRQVQAFREGFSVVFPIKDLTCFTPDELVLVFGNTSEDWSVETLQESVRADHGFSMDSRIVRDVLDLMSLYDAAERRLFLSFATGSPRLPVGGFKALHPPLTIVRKLPEPGHVADEYLPSVMTCQNYIKMPEYTGQQILRSRLQLAVKEGQGAFLLS